MLLQTCYMSPWRSLWPSNSVLPVSIHNFVWLGSNLMWCRHVWFHVGSPGGGTTCLASSAPFTGPASRLHPGLWCGGVCWLLGSGTSLLGLQSWHYSIHKWAYMTHLYVVLFCCTQYTSSLSRGMHTSNFLIPHQLKRPLWRPHRKKFRKLNSLWPEGCLLRRPNLLRSSPSHNK